MVWYMTWWCLCAQRWWKPSIPVGIFKSILGGQSGGVGGLHLCVVMVLIGSRGIKTLLSAFMILCT